MSYGMFENWVEEQYGKYSVAEFLPDVSVTPSTSIGNKIYYNLNQSLQRKPPFFQDLQLIF